MRAVRDTYPNSSRSASKRHTTRIGQINFVNCLPVVLPVESGAIALPGEVTYDDPAGLNRSFAEGKLDVGAMSSFFFLDHGRLDLVETLAISSDGPVGSVLFFSLLQPEKLTDQSAIEVPSSSATSTNLLRLYFLEEFGISPQFSITQEPVPTPCQSALVIGDRALLFDDRWSAFCHRVDLGQWWNSYCGLPMVFGVWAAHASWRSASESAFQNIAGALEQSCQIGLSSMFEAVVEETRKRLPLERGKIESYFKRQLNYSFTDRHRQGLMRYKQLCQKHGLISPASCQGKMP